MKYNPAPRHIIWDWNGTLLNDVCLCVEIINSMLMERNLPSLTLDAYRDVFDFPVKDYYSKVGFDFEQEPFEVVGMEFIVRYNERKHECSLHDDVEDTLLELKKAGISHSILSARHEESLLDELEARGLSFFFDHVSGLSDNYANGKVESGKRLIKHLGLDPEYIVFIGDTTHDAEVAAEMGIRCIMIPNGHHTPVRLQQCNCTMVDHLSDVKNLILP